MIAFAAGHRHRPGQADAALGDILGDHHQVADGHAIASCGGDDTQFQRVEHLAALERHLVPQPSPLQPASPVATIRRGVQQLAVTQALEGPGLHGLVGIADRHQPFGEQRCRFPFRAELAAAQQHRAVERLALEIHRVHIHPGTGELHLDIRVQVAEAAQAR